MKVCYYPHQSVEQAKACGCLDCLRYLASIGDPEYQEALRQAFMDVLGEEEDGT